MATLSEQDRVDIWANYMRESGVSISKSDLRAAFDAIDDWFDANATTLNTALPLAARNGLSTQDKARLLKAVINKRYLTGA